MLRSVLITILCLLAGAYTVSSQTVEATDTTDSARIAMLTMQLDEARASEAAIRMEYEHLTMVMASDSMHKVIIRSRIDSLKKTTPAALVIVEGDTLFKVYAKQGGLNRNERAAMIADKISKLGHVFTLEPDSVTITTSESEDDIVYNEGIIMSVSDLDALWADTPRATLAAETRGIIVEELKALKAEHGFWQLVKRIGGLVGILIAIFVIFKLVNRAYHLAVRRILRFSKTHLRPLYIQKVELLNIRKQRKLLVISAKILRMGVDLLVIVLCVPLIFSLFPQTVELATKIVEYVWSPFYNILKDVVAYIPNLFTIIVICLVIRYIVKLVKYFATEISRENIKINGFFPDWAMPTFYIVRFLLYAFMVAMIYPYLPGSNSGVFQGVSVFVGLIVSLGSSSVIGNLMAGLVITYMRPFKMGDRVEIKDMTGDVIEKTPFVTRLLTPKNEVVTIPNSFIMSSQTINYSRSAQKYGLIIHTDVTMGYEIPWRKINSTLIAAALNTPGVVDDPKPFVLQTSLGDDYTVYQLNAYIRDATRLPDIYSDLHENIQDYFSREGLELVSPRYVSARDGNPSTVCKDNVR